MTETLPIMCSLTPAAITKGRAGLLPGLAERALTREVLDSGYRLTFAPSTDALLAIARTIDAERECCRWLTFDLTVAAGHAPFVLTLSGPPGAREFLDALFTA